MKSIKLSDKAHKTLAKLKKQTDIPIMKLMDKAVELLNQKFNPKKEK